MSKFDWSKEETFIPKPHWPFFWVWVFCGFVLLGYYLTPVALALLGK
jgi:hypothetical protein